MTRLPLLRIAALLAAVAACAPAAAVYKVVGPDGKITYTDQPPNDPKARWSATEPNGPAEATPATVLPLELRGPASKYPVTLYTSAGCEPCDTARQLLVGRGVPFAERLIVTSADSEALAQRVGARSIPAVTIGGQSLVGLAPNDWNAYLDAAGYPKQSLLPPTYRAPTPQPLVPPKLAPAEPPPQPLAPPPINAPAPAAPPPAPGGIRF